jgi:coiled-coil domain-containing protein 130
MSSLKAARADNFYHPPDWDPRKESRADFATKGQPKWKAHPLRERAKKLDEGILVIRFEMPFDVRCSGCGNRIGKGVRFDAEKKCVGKYHSTKIWSFRMMCAVEDGTSRTDRRQNAHYIEIHTDPKIADYVIVSGAQRAATSAPAGAAAQEERGVESLPDPEETARMAADPFYKLEHVAPQRAAAKARGPHIEALQAFQGAAWKDDYAASQAAVA